MDDFKTCVSDLTNSRQYGLNGSHLNRDKLPQSLNPVKKLFKPQKIEIWVFESAISAYKMDLDEVSSSMSD